MGAVWGGACAGSASSDAAPSRGYRRREPERTLLHATVRAHWKTFLAEMEERGEAGANLPWFVAGEFERYHGCDHLRATLRRRAQPQCALPLRHSRWRVRPRERQRALRRAGAALRR